MLTFPGKLKHRFLTRFSRARQFARLFGHPVDLSRGEQRGLIFLQLDGLSYEEFERAISERKLPFLKKLIDREHFRVHEFFSGVPSTTPAVQAEVMYGIRNAVPAFQFVRRTHRQIVRMLDQENVEQIAAELSQQGQPLLVGGSSFSNIYSGGADDSFGCVETANRRTFGKIVNPLRLIFVLVTWLPALLYIAGLTVLEFLIGIGDAVKAMIRGRPWWKELSFVPARVFVTIILREWVRLLVKLSIEGSSPIIYANLLGYDEQAHLRGPRSVFAQWSLKGIDRTIQDIFKSAKRCESRTYELVVFSDHGQEHSRAYEDITAYPVEAAVKRTVQRSHIMTREVLRTDSRFDRQRARRRPAGSSPATGPAAAKNNSRQTAEQIIVTAMGPLGHVYFPDALSSRDKQDIAGELVLQEEVPLVLWCCPENEGIVNARTVSGLYQLPEDRARVAGESHPFGTECIEELVAVCRHKDAGDLVICGWRPHGDCITFAAETGSHGGPGSLETRGFALIPDHLAVHPRMSANGHPYVRGEDLHQAGLNYLSVPHRPPEKSSGSRQRAQRADPFRVMTYNIHSAIGMDGRHSPSRIARVISDADADIVLLQEVDVGHQRSSLIDQPRAFADALHMNCEFFPVIQSGRQQYGLAVLSRFEIRLERAEIIWEGTGRREPRGALLCRVETPSGSVQLLNVHLGLTRSERHRQASRLLEDGWISNAVPTIIGGDFNAGPSSAVVEQFAPQSTCVQELADGHRPRPTFASTTPLRRIDHILVPSEFHVDDVWIPRTPTAAAASDHLPVIAELRLRSRAEETQCAVPPKVR